MKTHCSGRVLAGIAAVLLCGATSVQAQYNSGSSGVHGAFPPAQEDGTVPNTPYIVWNMRTGGVRYCSSYTLGSGSDQCSGGGGVFVQIPNTSTGGPATGIYEFTTVNITTITGVHRTVAIVGTSSNVPLTMLSQNEITISGVAGYQLNFHINGQTPPVANSNFAEAGGKGGPGGFDGGASGNGGEIPEHGAAGFGPSGGAGGQAGATTAAELNAGGAGTPPVNQSLTPLTGGSGGGGAAGVSPANTLNCGTSALGYGGGSGGGGGGALLLAASSRVTIGATATIFANGGSGARNNLSSCGLFGGGGGGGSVRIVAQEFVGAGVINVSAGTRQNGANPAAGGHVRIETALNTFSGSITGAGGGSFLSFPTAAVPANQPVLRVTAIAGTSAPANPSASLTAPDITFGSAIDAPVTVAVAASNVPLGTVVNVRVVPATGQPTTATTTGLSGTVSNSTATASVTLPPGAGVLTASATFTVGGAGGGGGGAFNRLPLIDGKLPERVEVATLADGRSRTYLIAESGARFEVGTLTR